MLDNEEELRAGAVMKEKGDERRERQRRGLLAFTPRSGKVRARPDAPKVRTGNRVRKMLRLQALESLDRKRKRDNRLKKDISTKTKLERSHVVKVTDDLAMNS